MTEKLHDGESGKPGPQDKRRYEAMLGALKAGEVCPRCTLGVQFRAEHPKGSPDGDNYLTLKGIDKSLKENTFLDYADSFLQYVKKNTPLSKPTGTTYSTKTYTE